MIEAYCKKEENSEFKGTNNSLGEDCPDKLYVIVEYDVTYTSTNTTIKNKVYKKLPIDLMQGKAYKLNLTIGLPIEFDIDVENVAGVEDWTNDTDNKITDLPIDSWDDINSKK